MHLVFEALTSQNEFNLASFFGKITINTSAILIFASLGRLCNFEHFMKKVSVYQTAAMVVCLFFVCSVVIRFDAGYNFDASVKFKL